MKVKLTTGCFLKGEFHHPGSVVDVDRNLALAWIAAKTAELAPEAEIKKSVAEEPVKQAARKSKSKKDAE